jgi:hypothetical protein
VIGFIANFLIKAVHHRFHMRPEETALGTAAEAGREVAAGFSGKPASA